MCNLNWISKLETKIYLQIFHVWIFLSGTPQQDKFTFQIPKTDLLYQNQRFILVWFKT